MALTTAQIQNAYVAFFNRPADNEGLRYWGSYAGSTGDLLNTFAQSAEYKSLYSGMNNTQLVNAVYQNLFGHAPDVSGLTYWIDQLDKGALAIGNIADAINKGAQGTDATIIANKVSAAAAFTTALDTTAEIVAYAGVNSTGLAAVKAWLAAVTSDAATLTSATSTAGLTSITDTVLNNVASNGSTFTLTTGVDNLVGGSGSDTFNATNTSSSAVLGGLDVVDGGAGTDVLNVADTATAAGGYFALPAGMTVKNVETINVTTNGAIAAAAATTTDISGIAGLTKFVGVAAGTTNSNITAAGTTDVNLTVAGNAQVDIAGGKAVSVVSGASGSGTVGVTGKDLTSVSVKGGGVANIDNLGGTAGTTTSVGTTMTAVTLDGIAGATAAVKGAAVTTLNLQNQKSALAVTVTNDTSTALTVNTNGVGYDATGATVADSVAAGSKAATINVNATGTKSNLTITATAAKTLNITGDAALTLAPIASVTKLDGSAATGNLTLGTLNTVTVDVKTGAGADTFTANTTNKLTVDSGAGNDNVTLSGALVAGSTVALGAGNDHLVGTSVASTSTTATSVIDGGDGTDTVSAQLINAGNAALFKNFEGLSLNSTTGLDVALLSGNTIGALYIDSISTNATYQNLTQSMGLTVSYVGDNSGVTNTLSMTGVSGTSDSYTITFDGTDTSTPASANVRAGVVAVAGIENFSIVSGGTKAWNELTLGADTSAQKVTITGASNLDLTFASGFGSTTSPQTGVTTIDGSAATGKLAINLANVVQAAAGLTVKGGSAADTITTGASATTLTGGAGADNFIVTAAVAVSTTAPTITTITDAAAGDILTFTIGGTNVFNSTKVDVSTATALANGTTNALDLAVTAAGNTNNQISWFQYGGNTYIVDHAGVSATGTDLSTTDVVVKLTGLIDLSTATFAEGGAGASTLTLA